MTHRFSAYGLAMESNVALPGVAADSGGAPADVIVRLTESEALRVSALPGERAWYVSPERDDQDTPWLTVWRGDGFRFVYGEGAEFSIGLDGATVDGAWRPPLTVSDGASYVLGPVLAFALRLRGIVPLHAGAVVGRGTALLFMGPAGAGKSSTVAAIAALGHAVLSDDVVPVRVTPGGIVAAPGFPRVSVWDDTASAILRRAPGNLRPWSASYAKRCIDLPEHGFRFCDRPVPVGAIYLLQPPGDQDRGVRGLSAREALLALAANSYGGYLLDRRMREVEFDVLGAVARLVPVSALRFEGDLGRLLDSCAALLASRAAGD
jgi:hypothetical protein